MKKISKRPKEPTPPTLSPATVEAMRALLKDLAEINDYRYVWPLKDRAREVLARWTDEARSALGPEAGA